MKTVKVKMLGTPKILLNGHKVTFPYKKVEALFYYLTLNQEVSRTRIADMLWGDSNPDSARKNLRHAIYSIQKAFGESMVVSDTRDWLHLAPGITLYCDAADFLDNENTDVYAGEFLENFSVKQAELFDQWVWEQRRSFRSEYLKQLRQKAYRAGQEGDQEQAESFSVRYLKEEPTDEEITCFLMGLYEKERTYRKAIQVYHTLCQRLDEDFGISPLKETSELYYQIVALWNQESENQEDSSGEHVIGKAPVLKKLFELCSENESGSNIQPALLIQGASGVGKTFLLHYFLENHQCPEHIVLRVSCYPSESGSSLSVWNTLMYQLMEAIRKYEIRVRSSYLHTASYLFPAFCDGNRRPGAPDNFAEQISYQAAQNSVVMIFSKVVQEHPVILALDDVHWMDRASMDMLALLIRRLQERRLIVIMTAGRETSEHVRMFLDSLIYDKLLTVQQLWDFNMDETRQFINSKTQHCFRPEELQLIYQNTGGNALSLTHLIGAIDEQGGLENLPLTLTNIVEYRLRSLPEKERQVLSLISLFKEGVVFEILLEILNKEPMELLYICNELKCRSLVTEKHQEETVLLSVAHRRISEILDAQQNDLSQKILHFRIAKTLEDRLPQHADSEYYNRLSFHYRAGGDSFKAFWYKVMSLNYNSGLFCGLRLALLDDFSDVNGPENGVAYYDRLINELKSLRCQQADAAKIEQLQHMLYYAKGSYEIYHGLYEQGLELMQALVQMCERSGDIPCLIQAHRQFVYYSIQTYDVEMMEKHIRIGLELARENENLVEVLLFQQLQGLMYINQGRYELAENILKKLLVEMEHGTVPADGRLALCGAYVHCYLGECYRLQDDFPRAYEEYEKAIFFHDEDSSVAGVALFYAYYGYALLQNLDCSKAHMMISKAVSLYGNRMEIRGYTIALACEAYFHVLEGRIDGVADQLCRARQLDARMKNRYWHGILLQMEVKIRMELARRKIERPELLVLWEGIPIRQQYQKVKQLFSQMVHPLELERVLALEKELNELQV